MIIAISSMNSSHRRESWRSQYKLHEFPHYQVSYRDRWNIEVPEYLVDWFEENITDYSLEGFRFDLHITRDRSDTIHS